MNTVYKSWHKGYFTNKPKYRNMNNLHKSWHQGSLIDKPEYCNLSDEEKKKADKKEKLLVRPYPTATAICKCRTPLEAIWVAQRLNLAATLEQMVYEFATGQTDGQEIVDLVLNSIKS